MRIRGFKISRCWKGHGGIFIGAKINFPCRVCEMDAGEMTWWSIGFAFGLVAWTVSGMIEYDFKREAVSP